jgi:hypothetical protein
MRLFAAIIQLVPPDYPGFTLSETVIIKSTYLNLLPHLLVLYFI